MIMPTAAEHYDFANVEQNGKDSFSELFEKCKVYSNLAKFLLVI